jgi:putative ABC transport system permease protein
MLERKLLRDLARMKGQLLTIALVVAAGIAAYVSLQGNYVSLERAREAYYDRYRLGDVFAHLERAPVGVAARLEDLPGVARVEARLVEPATIALEGEDPIRTQVISLGASERAPLNGVRLASGRMVDPTRADEALLLSAFAEAQRIAVGARLPVVMNGRERELTIVGIAQSPEHVMAVQVGEVAPDPRRFAVLWMDHDTLAAAYDMRGAFNDVVIALQASDSPAARAEREAALIAGVDRLLESYGGLGAYGRARHPSNALVEGELQQLEAMSTVLPGIFLAVAALLLNVVISRLVHLQRPEIATLKAVGYGDVAIGLHFLELVLVIAALGSALGVGVGSWLGSAMLDLYRKYFDFPDLAFQLDGRSVAVGVFISAGAAVLGAQSAVRSVVALPPAEAMRPTAPARYGRSILDRLRLSRVAGASANMVVRELERRPLRAGMSVLAIAASVGLMVVGGWYYDAIDALVETQFHETLREDVTVSFIEPQPERAVRELAHLPGVLDAEGLRAVPVRFRAGHRHRDATIVAYRDDLTLRQPRDKHGRAVGLPESGILLTDKLAEILDVVPGDVVEVAVREGARQQGKLLVAGLIDESFGLQGHMRAAALADWLGEEPTVSQALLRVDSLAATTLDQRLRELPDVAGVARKREILARFRDQSAGMIMTVATIITLFAATITIGVVYNNARIALSLRSRDLASLRVLGFHPHEVSLLLLGEMAIQVLVALPFGMFFGKLFVLGLASTVDPETFRLPVVITTWSYGLAVLVALGASVVSALFVRRQVDNLDLIGVLKTRE